MLTLLRKIRRSLIDSGSARKYLLYVIGEIALVVIGILIALQINNWNTERHLKIQEKSILNEINRNIETNMEEVDDDLLRINDHIVSVDIILNHINRDLTFHDSLSYHFRQLFRGRYFNGVSSGNQVLMNNPEITRNDST